MDKKILTYAEMLKVQHIINRIIGNRNITKSIRREMVEELIIFNEIIEINRRQIGYTDDLSL